MWLFRVVCRYRRLVIVGDVVSELRVGVVRTKHCFKMRESSMPCRSGTGNVDPPRTIDSKPVLYLLQ